MESSMKSIIKPLELMDGEFTEFIGVWENFLPKELCVQIINRFEQIRMQSILTSSMSDETIKNASTQVLEGVEQFSGSNLGRKDESIFLNGVAGDVVNEINQYLFACLNEYISKYGQLRSVPLISSDVKAQKTESGGGYHVWHYENSHPDSALRELVWIIYLNDIDDGEGETEFLYQKRRLKPTTGTVVIWPAGMTHVHRGNPVYTKAKYILTGWFLKRPVE